MFYRMKTKKRDEWLRGENSVKDLIAYIERTGQMRDAQIDAIKTYLFLKIACENQPLVKLFSAGKFNSLDLDDLEISTSTRDALKIRLRLRRCMSMQVRRTTTAIKYP